jgi:hypothetical protein
MLGFPIYLQINFKQMDKKKLTAIEITELFLVKADWLRTFVGEIIREKTEDGEICLGTVVVNEGKIWSVGESQDELGKNLDEICIMKLDMGLHSDSGVTTTIFETKFFLN